MYDLEIEYLDEFGNIQQLGFNNVTYVCFRFYKVFIAFGSKKDIIAIDNVLDLKIKKI